MPEFLRGTIERITFHNEENGYTVAQLTPEGQSYTVTVIGAMLGINVGESVQLSGAWTAHPQYGRQFKAETVRTVLPATIVGLEKYLGSGLIKGIGPVTAHRIVRRFGLDTLRIIEDEPARLRDVLGVGPKRVATITRAWAEQQKIKEVMLFLQSHNVSTGLAVRIYKQYGDDAVEIVRSDPYRLARDIYGIGFITADKIARELGIAADAPERVAAGVAYVLSQAADEGNVYLPAAELTRRAGELLSVAPPLVEQGIRTLAEDERVWVEGGRAALAPASQTAGSGSANAFGSVSDRAAAAPSLARLAEERPVYLIPFYHGEIGVANRLQRLVEAPADRLAAFSRFDWPAAFAMLSRPASGRAPQPQGYLPLTPRQQEAVQAALTHKVTVLTGGPGTGKTTTVRAIIRLAEAAGVKTVLAAPTGRAAKRLSEAAGRPAKTIHRLLEVKPAEGFAFTRNEDNPLEADLVIVDEASMLDLLLTNHLLKAIAPGAHLLLVGDIDQLPSVGAGNVLRDVIEAIEQGAGVRDQGSRASLTPASCLLPPGSCAVVRLDTIFRQPEGSYIITNAHRINRGQMPILDNRNAADFFLFKEDDPQKAADLLVELVLERIPRKFGLKSDDIQVLSPMHRGEVGVAALNSRLQAGLNPPRPAIAERMVGGRAFRVGDRVMQIRNNYDKDVFNGDMGRITALDLEEQTLTVRMEDRNIPYDFLELDELVHAYAISIHKSQGSEFPAVVVPLLTTHYMMLQRNLLYTAVTRGQKLVVLVGSPRAIGIAVRADRAQTRFSGLAERLGRL
ncbi:MAG: ATP-dependent RecD-like DNA helicase [Chloroflexi bacterium]|nr:ATP-dependent RecD-like DNA helicase [Chloroflexota bacterium]